MTFRIAAGLGVAMSFAGPAIAQELNVYTYRQPELVQPVFEAFTKATGIKVNTIFASTGLEERIRTEGAASPADVLLVVDVGNIQKAADFGVAQPISSPVLDKAIPANLRDPKGLWFALTQRARVVYASKDRVKDTAITYEDLADPKWKGKVCIRSGKHGYNVALIGAGIKHWGEEKTLKWLEGVKANLAKKPSGGDRDVAKDILAGVCDIGLGNTYYVGLMRNGTDATQKAWGEAIKVIVPTFKEGGGTHVNVSGALVVKTAPNKANAVKFLEFMVSPEAQKIYAEVNYEYPVVSGVAIDKTIASFGDVKGDTLSLAEVAAQRGKAGDLVDAARFDN